MLVDCGGAGDPSTIPALEGALRLSGHGVADVRALVGTHAHSDHIRDRRLGARAQAVRNSVCTPIPATSTTRPGIRSGSGPPERGELARRGCPSTRWSVSPT